MDGVVLESPGFCYNRAVDFVCYIWVHNPSAIVQDSQQIVQNAQPGPGIAVHDPDHNLSAEYPQYDFYDWNQGLDIGNESNLTDYSYYGYYDYSDERRYLTQALSPVFLLLGTVGNILSAVILYRLSHEVLSTCLYLCVLAVIELVVLYSRCGNSWLTSVADLDISNILMMNSLSICKVYPFTFSFLFHLMRWLIVCVAVEGAIVTTHPLWLRQSFTTSRAEAVMLLLTVLLICFNMHFFWSFELIEAEEKHLYPGIMCQFNIHAHRASELFTLYIWPIMDTLVTDGIPSVIIAACAVLMLVQIVRGQHHGDEVYRAWRDRYHMDPRAVDQLLVTFAAVCVCFLPSTLPKTAIDLSNYINEDLYLDYDYSDEYQFSAHKPIMKSVFTYIEFAFLSLKFYLYLAISPRFRLEAKKLIRCTRCCKRMRLIPSIRHTESMANEPLMNQDGCQRSATDTSLHRTEAPI